MEKNTPVRKSHTNTADLLTWSENPPENSPAFGSAVSAARSRQVRMIIPEKVLNIFLIKKLLVWLIFFGEMAAVRWDPKGGIWWSSDR